MKRTQETREIVLVEKNDLIHVNETRDGEAILIEITSDLYRSFVIKMDHNSFEHLCLKIKRFVMYHRKNNNPSPSGIKKDGEIKNGTNKYRKGNSTSS